MIKKKKFIIKAEKRQVFVVGGWRVRSIENEKYITAGHEVISKNGSFCSR